MSKRYLTVIHYMLLVLIIIGAFAIRIYGIGTIPRGALIDEAHFGYLAKSLLETGKDEHGIPWPIVFKGFGDAKLPMGAYLDIPFVHLFGLNNVAIRFPSVIAGTLIVVLSYLLARSLKLGRSIALIAALVAAFSPWTYILSRFGFESNIALCFYMAGLVCLINGSRLRRISLLILAAIFLAATWYSYIAYRPVTLLLFPSWLLLFSTERRSFKQIVSSKLVLIPLSIFLVMVSLFALPGVAGSNTTRLKQVNFAIDPGNVMRVDESRAFCAKQLYPLLCYITWNKPTVMYDELSKRFLEAFGPSYLFIDGTPETPFLSNYQTGQFLLVLLPFFYLGIAALLFDSLRVKGLSRTKAYWFLTFLLIAAVPALIAGPAQKVRLSPMFPFALITILFGIQFVASKIKKLAYRRVFYILLSLCYLILAFRFIVSWLGYQATKYDFSYQSYLVGVMPFVHDYLSKNDSAIVILKPFYSDPLMFYAYYNSIDPRWYQANAQLGPLEQSGFQHTIKLDRLVVSQENVQKVVCEYQFSPDSLYVSDERFRAVPIYAGKSFNGVDTYASVYRIGSLLNEFPCQ